MSTVVQRIEAILRAALPIERIDIGDDSAQHAGHAGARGGGGHFRLQIVSPAFAGKTRIARHRLVYDALAPLMQHEIHALVIVAQSPDEV